MIIMPEEHRRDDADGLPHRARREAVGGALVGMGDDEAHLLEHVGQRGRARWNVICSSIVVASIATHVERSGVLAI